MEHNTNNTAHESFNMVKLPDGRIVNVRSGSSLFPHTEGLSNLVSTPAQQDESLE